MGSFPILPLAGVSLIAPWDQVSSGEPWLTDRPLYRSIWQLLLDRHSTDTLVSYRLRINSPLIYQSSIHQWRSANIDCNIIGSLWCMGQYVGHYSIDTQPIHQSAINWESINSPLIYQSSIRQWWSANIDCDIIGSLWCIGQYVCRYSIDTQPIHQSAIDWESINSPLIFQSSIHQWQSVNVDCDIIGSLSVNLQWYIV